MNRSFRRLVAYATLALMLSGQWALAAHACMRPAGEAMPMMQAAMAEMDSGDCHHQAEPDLNLCQKHCQNEPQSAGDHSPLAAVAYAPAFVATLPTLASTADPGAPVEPVLARTTAPPLTIRHCCWRI